jgi:hypothetical protein
MKAIEPFLYFKFQKPSYLASSGGVAQRKTFSMKEFTQWTFAQK